MKLHHFFIFCCFSVVSVEVSAVMEVSGHVGGEVSIRCAANWTADNSSEHYNLYFCKGTCSRQNIVIQTARRRLAGTQRGRYSVEVDRDDGAFKVTIIQLERADTGTYHCGVGKTVIVLYQEVNLTVLNASTVRPGSPSSSPTTLESEAATQPQGNFSLKTAASPVTPPAAEETTIQEPARKLTETTVVIIISVSLALLVCAVIPLIFYGHCRSNTDARNKPVANNTEANCCEQNAGVAPNQPAVRLQFVGEPESKSPDASQYAAIYQALDPTSLD